MVMKQKNRENYLQTPANVRSPMKMVKATQIPTNPPVLERTKMAGMVAMATRTWRAKKLKKKQIHLE